MTLRESIKTLERRVEYLEQRVADTEAESNRRCDWDRAEVAAMKVAISAMEDKLALRDRVRGVLDQNVSLGIRSHVSSHSN